LELHCFVSKTTPVTYHCVCLPILDFLGDSSSPGRLRGRDISRPYRRLTIFGSSYEWPDGLVRGNN
jgi:hypothetical protein